MKELIFPICGAVFVLAVVLPLGAIAAKALLTLLEHRWFSGALSGESTRYWILCGSSALPLLWCFSAGFHEIETGGGTLACHFDAARQACLEPAYFALALLLVLLVAALVELVEDVAPSATPKAESTVSGVRASRIIQEKESLRFLRGRLVLTADDGFTVGVCGGLFPRVYLGDVFAQGLSDAMLEATLVHEAQHLRSRDSLRYWVLRLLFRANPIGRLFLARHIARWAVVREADCDRSAVLDGASPLALADAIVRAARSGREHPALGLVSADVAVLKLRVEMLFAFSENPPRPRSSRPASILVAFLAVGTIVLPHLTTTLPLDQLHEGSEHALSFLWE